MRLDICILGWDAGQCLRRWLRREFACMFFDLACVRIAVHNRNFSPCRLKKYASQRHLKPSYAWVDPIAQTRADQVLLLLVVGPFSKQSSL
jgi:hypothetical protein